MHHVSCIVHDVMKNDIMKYDIMKYDVMRYDIIKYGMMKIKKTSFKDCARPELTQPLLCLLQSVTSEPTVTNLHNTVFASLISEPTPIYPTVVV